MFQVKSNVAYCIPRGAFICLHVGSVAVYIGSGMDRSHRLELLTARQRFRWTKGSKAPPPAATVVDAETAK